MVLKRRHFIVAAGAAGTVGFYGAAALAQSAAVAKANTGGNGKGKAAASTILVLGDSLSAEYGLRRGSGWVALLAKKLSSESVPARVGAAACRPCWSSTNPAT